MWPLGLRPQLGVWLLLKPNCRSSGSPLSNQLPGWPMNTCPLPAWGGWRCPPRLEDHLSVHSTSLTASPHRSEWGDVLFQQGSSQAPRHWAHALSKGRRETEKWALHYFEYWAWKIGNWAKLKYSNPEASPPQQAIPVEWEKKHVTNSNQFHSEQMRNSSKVNEHPTSATENHPLKGDAERRTKGEKRRVLQYDHALGR